MTVQGRLGLLIALVFMGACGLIVALTEQESGTTEHAPAPAGHNRPAYVPAVAAAPRGIEPVAPVAVSGGDFAPAAGRGVAAEHSRGVRVVVAGPEASTPARSVTARFVDDVVRPIGEQLTALQSQPAPQDQNSRAGTGRADHAAQPAVSSRYVSYTVRSGDSLTRIARTVYGPEHGSHWRDIYEANRDQMDSETDLHPGQILRIPTGQASAAEVARRRRPQDSAQPRYEEMTVDEFARRVRESASPTGGDTHRQPQPRMYVVQRGDNLTKIARNLLQDGSRDGVQRLIEANRDRIEDPNRLPVGLQLRIPG